MAQTFAQSPPPLPGQATEIKLINPAPAPIRPLQFSKEPTTAEISQARIFEEPLIPTWGDPSPAENETFAAALIAFSSRTKPDDFSALERFRDASVCLAWYPSLLFALGWEYYHTGYYSKALDSWEEAWLWLQDETDPAARRLADRTVGELAKMHARIGEVNRLEEILAEVKGRRLSGPGLELIASAKQAVWMMQNRPEVAFRCGPLALRNVGRVLYPNQEMEDLVFVSASTTKGFSLPQLCKLSQDTRLNFQAAWREPGAEVIVPCVVHWKVGHYAALLKQEGDRFYTVDPTFGSSKWISKEAVDTESSGYFAVPAATLPKGWRTVGSAEGQAVWGKGVVAGSDPNQTTPYDSMADPDCATPGMAVHNVHLLLVSLHIEDTPIAFSPPRGPPVRFTVTYNQREANQPSGFTYFNFGQKWTCNWLSYIRDNGAGSTNDVEYYVGGGGTEIFTYNSQNQTYNVQWRLQATLTRTSSNAYSMAFPDGSRLVFDRPDGTVGNSRKVFLTQIIDVIGYTNLLNYDADLRLATVTDPAAQKTNLTFFYNADTIAGSTFTVQKVTDRYGRSANFGYQGLLSQLESVTDPVNLTSKVAYAYGIINKLETPYGATTFAYGEEGGVRWLETKDPNGQKTRTEFNQSENIGIPISDPGTLVPAGMYTRNFRMFGRNTFYWDKKAMRESPGNYSKARIYHWLHLPDMVTASGVLESYKEPLENRVWFNYPGQSNAYSATIVGTMSLPNRIGRVLDDGHTQLYQLYRNSLGRITNAIDPIGRNFTFDYATNQIDLLAIRQTRGANNELLAGFSYNAQHLPLTATNAAGQVTRFGYNSYGQITAITNALSQVTSFAYDSSGRLTNIDGALSGTSDFIAFAYDSADRVRTVTDSDGYTVTMDFDALDRPITNTYPDQSTEIVAYKYLDPETYTDRAGRITRFAFDALRQLREIQEATNWITRFDYCDCGEISSLIDPLGRATSWVHDLQGRVAAKVYADGSTVEYGYEKATSRLKTLKNERGQTRTYTYEYDDNLLYISYANPTNTPNVSYYYDTNYSRLTAMVDGSGTNLFSYNPITSTPTLGAGRLSSVNGPFSDDTLEYFYDELGRLKYERMYNGSIAQPLFDRYYFQRGQAFDALGRLSQVTNTLGPSYSPGLGTFTYAYQGASTRISTITHPNSQVASFGYFDTQKDFRLKAITNIFGGVSKFTFDYNRVGAITNWMQQVSGGSAKNFRLDYDPIDQLTNILVLVGGATNTTYAYGYDLAGNRLSECIGTNAVKASFNPLNQLIYKETGGTSTNRQYEWDEENRLRAVIEGSRRIELYYDGFGRCAAILEKTSGTLTLTRLLTWTGDRLCQELNIRGIEGYYKWYYDEGYFDHWNLSTCYFTRDHLGSVREAVRNVDGLVARRSDYDPFGRRTVTDDNPYIFGSFPHGGPELGFAGLFTLSPEQLVMANHRVYDPDLGRWLSRDLIGEAGGVNLYRYAWNDPVNWVDLDGLCPSGSTGPMNSLGSGGNRPPRTPRVANAAGSGGEDGPSRPNGFVSGYREIMAKARAARTGDVGAMGEIEAAKYLRSQGYNVHFQTPLGSRGPNTADLLVGGQRGTGLGGTPWDVLTPRTVNPNNVILSIAGKANQAPNIILNLRHTPIQPGQLGNVMQRLQEGFGVTEIQQVSIIK